MNSKSPSECYVYITLPGATEPVTAARFELTKNSADLPLGRLVYGKSYLERDDAVPFAAIHRRSVNGSDDGTTKTDVLVVSKVGQPGGAAGCTVGLVVASGNPQADDEARRMADEKARSFECGRDRRLTSGAVPAFGRVDN